MATVLNASGVPLPYSGISAKHFSATNSGPLLFGSAGNDLLWGDASVSVTMYGGLGDDIYYLYASSNRVSEKPNEGIDTVNTWMSYALPDNFENLVVTGDKRFAFGNLGNNIITGGSGQQTLDGSRGNDVLKGGAGADIFVVTKGNGSDLILDFAADDSVRIGSYGFTSFGQVRDHMVQSGANVRLNLSASEFLVFANTTIDKFSANQFKLALDKSALHLTFSDEFNTLSLWNGSSGTWDSNFWWGAANGSTLADNNERQWYIDTGYGPTKSVNPFDVDDGVLTITAARAPAEIRPYINNYEYTSGLLTTFESFSQTYGYFEIRADMPDRQGTWPAFWLLPADGSWPPELDVVEMRGQNRTTSFSVRIAIRRGATLWSPPQPTSRTRPGSTPTACCGPRMRWSGTSTMSRLLAPPRRLTCTIPCICWSTWPLGAWRERRRTGSSRPLKCRSTTSGPTLWTTSTSSKPEAS